MTALWLFLGSIVFGFGLSLGTFLYTVCATLLVQAYRQRQARLLMGTQQELASRIQDLIKQQANAQEQNSMEDVRVKVTDEQVLLDEYDDNKGQVDVMDMTEKFPKGVKKGDN